ncbi:EscU/YscU/HrcU family type III secretion system export apparatus switch protein [Gryllotalpicola sp.]|uniref:EscU/YscU/HrcU family type III secretion system export apparatus switch protein n=1 Tax=Gryllotalpicola sp. TaxID=1932787 RepID=UPI00262163C0|nr:EscU/YscU/HrcU family type III secretion system export apparatus switch protein [Gryllotalpicola sp.]
MERTEQATQKHLQELRRDGKLGRSQEFSSWLGIGLACALLPVVITAASTNAVSQLFTAGSIMTDPDPQKALIALENGLGSVLGVLTPIFVALIGAIFTAAAAQGGIRFRRLKPHFDGFNVVNGAKRLFFSGQAWWELLKSLLKSGGVAVALYLIIQSILPTLMSSGGHSVGQLLDQASGAVMWLLIVAIAAGVGIALIDVFVTQRRNRKHSMMTKYEVKQEHRQNDGDPLLRGQRRSRAIALTRNRMILAVSEASVVMINPTHFAVALRYEPGKSAPYVVAKGQGFVAQRIREEADRLKVPMVRDIPLTRALHAQIPLGGEITVEFYTAIAQVLTFVAMLKRRGALSGVHDRPGGASR